MSLPFHITIGQQKDEGAYLTRLYCVPVGTARSQPAHQTYLFNAGVWDAPVALEGKELDSLGSIGVSTESEYEQTIPSLQTLKVQFVARPELIPLIQAARSTGYEVWMEVTLTQQILDAPNVPNPPNGASIVWPLRTRSVFWGILNSSSLHGNPTIQRFQPHARWGKSSGSNSIIRMDKTHIGEIDMEFIHWEKVSDSTALKDELDSLAALSDPGVITPGVKSLGTIITSLLNRMMPGGNNTYIADDRLIACPCGSINRNYGSLEIAISPDGTNWTNNVWDIYVTDGDLWFDGATAVPPTASPNSFYHWTSFGQALAELGRDLFLTFQIEIPAMGDIHGNAKVLAMQSSGAPLNVWIDNDQGGIDYNPCAAYASSYKVTEPDGNGILFPQPPYTNATSPMVGGSAQNYTTLFRLMGSDGRTPPHDSPEGWELYTIDSHGNLQPARFVKDLVTQSVFQDWTAVHAWKRIARWGLPRASLTIKGTGVGVEPFGMSSFDAKGVQLDAPKKTFLVWDWGEFPLQRQIYVEPGILSTEFDEDLENAGDRTARLFTTIGCKRTPGAGVEWKLIETMPSQFTLPPMTTPFITTNPNPPPPPGGPPDPPTVSITNSLSLAGSLAGSHALDISAVNTTGISQVTVAIDGILMDTQVGSRTGGAYVFTVDTTKYSGTIASPRSHTIKVTAYDLGGNTGTATLPIIIAN